MPRNAPGSPSVRNAVAADAWGAWRGICKITERLMARAFSVHTETLWLFLAINFNRLD
jgi:hypothetical protein